MKIKHLLKQADYADVLKNGGKTNGKNLSLYYLRPANKEETLVVGTIISKKTEPLAVRRNRIRRIIYAFFRDYKGEKFEGKAVLRMRMPESKKNKKKVANEIREDLETFVKRITGKKG